MAQETYSRAKRTSGERVMMNIELTSCEPCPLFVNASDCIDGHGSKLQRVQHNKLQIRPEGDARRAARGILNSKESHSDFGSRGWCGRWEEAQVGGLSWKEAAAASGIEREYVMHLPYRTEHV
jgi:hypothetical protein